MTGLQGLFFWGFLLVFGLAMYVVAPRSRDEAGFFRGHDASGRPASQWALMMSIFISWIFAKSVTNAANLGRHLRGRRRSGLRRVLALDPDRGDRHLPLANA